MSKQQFRVTNFKPETLARIKQANDIVAEYDGQVIAAEKIERDRVSAAIERSREA
jgi:hypothetical protein